MAINQQTQKTGNFVPTTNVWEISRLNDIDINSPEFRQLLVRLYQNVNQIALSLNKKETGTYAQQEFVTGSEWFPNPANINTNPQKASTERQVYRKVINFGTLPAAGTKSVAHNLGINIAGKGNQWSWVKLYAVSTSPNAMNPLRRSIPIPYVGVINAADSLELSLDTLNVNITTAGTDYAALGFTITYVVIEWVVN